MVWTHHFFLFFFFFFLFLVFICIPSPSPFLFTTLFFILLLLLIVTFTFTFILTSRCISLSLCPSGPHIILILISVFILICIPSISIFTVLLRLVSHLRRLLLSLLPLVTLISLPIRLDRRRGIKLLVIVLIGAAKVVVQQRVRRPRHLVRSVLGSFVSLRM